MAQSYVLAILVLAIGILISILLKPKEVNLEMTSHMKVHAHNTHYYFAEPKRLMHLFPDIVESMRLKDAWVEGEGENAMEVYDMPTKTSFQSMWLKNITVMIVADSKTRYTAYHVTLLQNFIWGKVTWKVNEVGPNHLEAMVYQDVRICLPAIMWAFVTADHQQYVSDLFTEKLNMAKKELENLP